MKANASENVHSKLPILYSSLAIKKSNRISGAVGTKSNDIQVASLLVPAPSPVKFSTSVSPAKPKFVEAKFEGGCGMSDALPELITIPSLIGNVVP